MTTSPSADARETGKRNSAPSTVSASAITRSVDMMKPPIVPRQAILIFSSALDFVFCGRDATDAQRVPYKSLEREINEMTRKPRALHQRTTRRKTDRKFSLSVFHFTLSRFSPRRPVPHFARAVFWRISRSNVLLRRCERGRIFMNGSRVEALQ